MRLPRVTGGYRRLPLGAVISVGVALPSFVFAARDIPLQISILSHDTVKNIAEYISIVYQYLVGLAGLMAVTMIMYAGMKWIFAGGDKSKITAARDVITHAIIGLILALGSYLILNTINPALVELKVPKVDEVGRRILPGAWCPNEGDFVGAFACGKQFTSRDNPRLGGSCLGSHCEAGKSCRRSRNGQVYACLDPAICPSTCDQINHLSAVTSNNLLRIVCESDLCKNAIPTGCRVLEDTASLYFNHTNKCIPAATLGDHCNTNEDCGRDARGGRLYCVTARGYNSCENFPAVNLPNWEDCDLGVQTGCGPSTVTPRSKCIDTIGTDGDCSDGGEGAACASGADCREGLRCHDCDGFGNFENDKCGRPGTKTCGFYSEASCNERVNSAECYI